MKTKLCLSLLFLQFFCACTESESRQLSASDVDAARNFIRASLNNDFNLAQEYMLTDSTNNQLLKMAANNRAGLTKEENRKYQESTIRIYDTRKINDSESVILYDNSYKNVRDSLRAVHRGNEWLIDLKYTFLPNRP